MREVNTTLLKKLDLAGAASAEATTWRNLLPPEPWVETLTLSPGHFAQWVSARLEAGHRNAPGWPVDVRKAHQAFRPVPVVGVAERIAFRALTDWVLQDVELSERSQDDYKAFIAAPIRHGLAGTGIRRLSQATVEYVVQADISSFYQYVDHGVLLTELENRTGKVEASRLLVELLGELQGATFGLPQLLDASDKLSELYIEALQRNATRRIGDVWRFNDDFRLAVNGYGNAQQALEELSAAARPLGLVLNDRKSSIVKFSTYFFRHITGATDDPDVEVNPAEIELVEDEAYPDTEGTGLEEAKETLARISAGPPSGIDLSSAAPEDVKDLRKCFNTLAREASPLGLEHVTRVFRYVPQLTPRLGDYLVALSEAGHNVRDVWTEVSQHTDAMNAWQRAWVTNVARRLNFLDESALGWIRQQFDWAPVGLLNAECALALAMGGEIAFAPLDEALRTQPEALAPWYAVAMNYVDMTTEQRKAVRGSSRLFELLVSSGQ
ncbi:RNA-directed DNA polymerase [Pedococcus sp. 2YAF34]|uniref:RNA-directed DNA polymerase n=1 Tax=Pedococcus sp. 2YAF34 TaxID=3233032 RepID=UPI003F9BD5CB